MYRGYVQNAEANIPAQKTEANADARLSRPDGHSNGSSGAEGPAAERAPSTDRPARVGQEVELEGERPPAPAPGVGPEGGRPARWREVRLRRSADFDRVRQEGRTWSHPLLVLVAAPNTIGQTRIGVVAGRRLGTAVARNRAKRLLREAARHLHPRLVAGWDLLLIARPPILTVREPEVEAALERLAREARLWEEE